MKTPEEIKKGLLVCVSDEDVCGNCTYYNGNLDCMGKLHTDALAYIQQLEDAIDNATQLVQSANELIKERLKEMESRLAQVERERDAAVSELKNSCVACRFVGKEFDDSPCEDCFQRDGKYPWSPMVRTKFEWRGVCAENTEEDS